MNSRKIASFLAVGASTLLLTACQVTQNTSVNIYCSGGSSSGIACNAAVHHRVNKTGSIPLSQFDANQLSVDLSQSNVAFTNSNGTLSVKVMSGSTVQATTVFAWHRVGDTLYPSTPQTVTTWVQNNGSAGDRLDFELQDLDWNPQAGTNTMTAIVEYGSSTPVGDSDSLFIAPNELLGL